MDAPHRTQKNRMKKRKNKGNTIAYATKK